ncbi:MAG TPA: ABC transporter permease, partial [Kofleriaceae bacterium]|nr:ABC transporter permease [Kofleriaceae bacterium]
MHVLPILSTLRRHRTAAALIVLEIAFTCAIVCNAIFLIGERLARMDQPSGVAEDELIRVQVTGTGKEADAMAVTAQDLGSLRAIPGVRSAAVTSSVPFDDWSGNSPVSTISGDPAPPFNAGIYLGSADLLETLGVRLTSGRDFDPEEYVDLPLEHGRPQLRAAPSVIITRGLAEALFPGESPLGRPLYVLILGEEPLTIVGVIERLARADYEDARAGAAYAFVLPMNVPNFAGMSYLLRVDPARRAEVLAAVDAALDEVDPSRVILARQTFAEIRRNFFRQDRAMAYLLTGVSLGLLVITALGIVGLASSWVQQRTRQIGIRRALGATRGDILRYFQVENF